MADATLNVANSTLTTDFNVTPYYDDYDVSKNFYRILYRPGFAVQARELTQMQTLLQKQIDRFGKHVFREGSIVLPGQFSIEKDVDYIKIKDLNSSNVSVNVNDFLNKEVFGQTNGIKGYVIDARDGVETTANTKTLYVRYQSGSLTNTSIKVFVDDEPLTSNAGNVTLISANSTGKGSRFVISEGVVFAKEHFIYFPSQSIVIDRYGSSPTCRVGFNITEDIIRYTDDASLLDPALEASNFQAPGADRLKLTPTLAVLDINDTTGAPNFVELLTIRDGVIEELYDRPQYNVLRDEMAKRTSDESGDYYVNGLGVRLREHKDTGINGGLYANGNTSLLAVGVEPGTAYVKGYEVGLLGNTKYVSVEKGLTYGNISGQLASASMGNYININEAVGTVELDQGTLIQLYDTAQKRITENKWSDAAQTGTLIGNARVQTIEYDSGNLGTAQGGLKLYLYDIKMNGVNSFANVKSVYLDNSTDADFGADVILESNNAVLQEPTISTLLYATGVPFTRTIRDSLNAVDTSFSFKKTESATISSVGQFTVSTTSPETLPYGVTTLSSSQKNDILVVINEDCSVPLVGTVAGTSGANTLTGTLTKFTSLNPGDKIEFSNVGGPTGVYTIYSITDNVNMQLVGNLNENSTANDIVKIFKKGDILDLDAKGSSGNLGAPRVVTQTATDSMTIDLKEDFGATKGAVISYRASRSPARESAKVLNTLNFTQINCATHTAGVTGPYSLGVADIYRLRQIRKDSSAFTSNTQGIDVTSSFTFDNGQRDQFYDFASITPKGITLTSGDKLLIEYDAFTPSFSSGAGYFSVDSYNENGANVAIETIPIFTSPVTKRQYDLRDHLDFRPVKSNTASFGTAVSAATTNPSTFANFFTNGTGLKIPAASSQISYDYSFYKARRDLVVIDKNGTISIIKGIPDENPVTPLVPENTMALAALYIAPFPSLAPNYAQLLNRKDLSSLSRKLSNKRFTMKDIGTLRDRIVNLEYYASLTTLEKSAVDLQVLDENGLNRFKNGIFVDTFRDHSLGDTESPAYSIVVDKDEKSIRPIYTMDSFRYQRKANTGVVITGDLATLPYTEANVIVQNKATSARNIEVSSYRFIGNLYLTPSEDMWVDTQYLEDNAVTIGPNGNNLPQPTATEWNSWQKKVVGYKLYNKKTGKLLATFDANEKDLAFNNAYYLSRNVTFNKNTLGLTGSKFESIVETVYESSRTGTETFPGISEDSESLGNRIVDVGIIPYIRPQTIKLNARGLKANTKFFVYFDGENLTGNTTPLTVSEYNLTFPVSATTDGEGDDIISDASGEVYAYLRLPSEKRFRTGTKEVVITDSPTNSEADASSAAKSYFVSQGLVQYKQDTILTTRQVIQLEKEVTDVKTSTTQYTQPLGPSCTAYSFLAKAPEGEEGLFLTSVDLYFQAKHPTLGVWVEIREMNSAGGITRNQVPFSEVWIPSSEIQVSADASVAQKITFPSPVFLYNDTQYAFVIHTIGLNPDTYLWISRLGEIDIETNTSVTARPLTGTLYTTNNNLNWDIVPDVDLKITFRRAAFTTGSAGTIDIANLPVEKLTIKDVSAPLNTYGETFVGNDILTLSSISGGTIATGDFIVGDTSTVNSSVLTIGGSLYTMSNTGYTLNETANVANNLGLRGITASITGIKRATATLASYKAGANVYTAEFISSNGNFRVNDIIRGTSSGATANVVSVDNYRYSVVDFEPSYLNFGKTSIEFGMKSTVNSTNTLASSYTTINDNDNYYFGEEQVILSRTNEVNALGSEQSNQIRVTMSSSSEFLSPVLDLSRTHSVYVDNIINANTLNENTASSGALTNKYISKPITLAEGQDAEDLLVIITGYRPPTSDIKIWAKILNSEDGEAFDDSPWIEMEKVDDSIYSSAADLDDFKEFSFKFASTNLTGTNGEVQYTNSQGITFTGFKYFSIKIGLSATNSAVVPRVADLRALALQL